VNRTGAGYSAANRSIHEKLTIDRQEQLDDGIDLAGFGLRRRRTA
jgi:hypothetical protein